MTMFIYPTLDVGSTGTSARVGDILSGLADKAVLTLSNSDIRFVVSLDSNTAQAGRAARHAVRMSGRVATRGKTVPIDRSELAALERTDTASPHQGRGPFLARAYVLHGMKERVALRLRPEAEATDAIEFLDSAWRDLRSACLNAQTETKTKRDVSAGWDLLDQISIATLLLDRSCTLMQANLSGRRLLRADSVLRRGSGGVFAAVDSECAQFRDAVAACAMAEHGGETMICLTTPDRLHQVPVTLAPYYKDNAPTGLVLATLPTPPSTEKVEQLARKLGLSSAEARVAALLQLGHSNREAAEISGLKPQTFNTYAKRVLGKLNVKGRAEMAQMLTWQATGGGPK